MLACARVCMRVPASRARAVGGRAVFLCVCVRACMRALLCVCAQARGCSQMHVGVCVGLLAFLSVSPSQSQSLGHRCIEIKVEK